MTTRALINIRTRIASALLPWISDAVIAGYFPERIGRIIVIDQLVAWSEGAPW